MPAIEKISLYNQSNGSDKVYVVNLVQVTPNSFHVVGFNGRRGSTLTRQEKTKSPVSYAEAKNIYDTLVSKKKKDNYFEGEEVNGLVSGSPSGNKNAPSNATGLKPQLLNSIDIADANSFIKNDDYQAQEKKDGTRLMISKTNGVIIGSNKLGNFTSIAQTVNDFLLNSTLDNFVLDGEAIGDHLYIFDLIKLNGQSLEDVTAETRYQLLAKSFSDSEYVHIVGTAFTTEEKLNLYTRVMDEGGEGLVFKRKISGYTPGRPNSGGDQFKLKFVESASCVVIENNTGKRSVKIGLYEKGSLVEYGNVTIPVNQPFPDNNLVIEVRYLYAYRNGSLIQPVYLGIRDDITHQECDVSQLKYKQELKAA